MIWVVGARHAQRVVCTHLMLTPSLPLPRCPTLHVCRHSSTAVMPCGCDCTHWCCWWLLPPIPLLLPPPLPFPLLCCFITRCVGSVCGDGESDACFTQPHHQPLANNCRLVVACLCWWLRGRRVSHSQAMLCCLLVPAWHVLLTPSHIRTSVFATWARHRQQIGRSRQVCCVLCVQLSAVVGAVTCTVWLYQCSRLCLIFVLQ